jgi:HK97 family phage portal protein
MWSFKNLFKKKEEKAQQLIGDYLQFINSMDAQLSCQANEIRLNQDLSFIREVFYYMASKPVADSIDLISEKFSMITPVLINQETGEMETEHDVLALLNRPNPDNTQSEFLFRYAAFYLMTGNSFIRSFGTTSFPPSEMSILLPTLINFEGDVVEGKVRAFTYQENSISQRFNISEEGGDLRYINRTNTSELWQVKNINPLGTTPYGLSLMNAIQLEIEQQIAANKHNLGLLENGARLSGILSTEGNLSKDQREFIKEQFRTLYTGSGNAGKTIFTEGGGGKVNYNQLSTSAKDMDFFVLKKDNKFDIYSRYKVPLPLVSPDHMTMDNYREAKLSLWDDAVIPLNNRS